MENEVELNLSVLLRVILKEQGVIRVSPLSISEELNSDSEYRVVINIDDDGYLELSLEEK